MGVPRPWFVWDDVRDQEASGETHQLQVQDHDRYSSPIPLLTWHFCYSRRTKWLVTRSSVVGLYSWASHSEWRRNESHTPYPRTTVSLWHRPRVLVDRLSDHQWHIRRGSWTLQRDTQCDLRWWTDRTLQSVVSVTIQQQVGRSDRRDAAGVQQQRRVDTYYQCTHRYAYKVVDLLFWKPRVLPIVPYGEAGQSVCHILGAVGQAVKSIHPHPRHDQWYPRDAQWITGYQSCCFQAATGRQVLPWAGVPSGTSIQSHMDQRGGYRFHRPSVLGGVVSTTTWRIHRQWQDGQSCTVVVWESYR